MPRASIKPGPQQTSFPEIFQNWKVVDTMIEDIRHEILWYCRTRKGELWSDVIADRLGLDFDETATAMEMLGDASQLNRLPYGRRRLFPRDWSLSRPSLAMLSS